MSIKQHNYICYVQDNASRVLYGLYDFTKCYPYFINEKLKVQRWDVTWLCILHCENCFKFHALFPSKNIQPHGLKDEWLRISPLNSEGGNLHVMHMLRYDFNIHLQKALIVPCVVWKKYVLHIGCINKEFHMWISGQNVPTHKIEGMGTTWIVLAGPANQNLYSIHLHFTGD